MRELWDDDVRCYACGNEIKFFKPRQDIRQCCKLEARKLAELARRKDYPRNEKADKCLRYLETGICKLFERNGWCHFAHPPLESLFDLSFGNQERCGICTLPTPCNVHFPTMGGKIEDIERFLINDPSKDELSILEPLMLTHEEEQQESKILSEGSTSSNAKQKFKFLEIVGAPFRDEMRYCYMVKDFPDTGLVVVACVDLSQKSKPGKTIRLSRSKIVRLHGILYKGKQFHDPSVLAEANKVERQEAKVAEEKDLNLNDEEKKREEEQPKGKKKLKKKMSLSSLLPFQQKKGGKRQTSNMGGRKTSTSKLASLASSVVSRKEGKKSRRSTYA